MIPEIHNAKHCVADDKTQSFKCLHCGATAKYPDYQTEILNFTRMGNRFTKRHRNCKPKKEK